MADWMLNTFNDMSVFYIGSMIGLITCLFCVFIVIVSLVRQSFKRLTKKHRLDELKTEVEKLQKQRKEIEFWKKRVCKGTPSILSMRAFISMFGLEDILDKYIDVKREEWERENKVSNNSSSTKRSLSYRNFRVGDEVRLLEKPVEYPSNREFNGSRCTNWNIKGRKAKIIEIDAENVQRIAPIKIQCLDGDFDYLFWYRPEDLKLVSRIGKSKHDFVKGQIVKSIITGHRYKVTSYLSNDGYDYIGLMSKEGNGGYAALPLAHLRILYEDTEKEAEKPFKM